MTVASAVPEIIIGAYQNVNG